MQYIPDYLALTFFKNRETFQKENLFKDGVITDFQGFTQLIFAEQA